MTKEIMVKEILVHARSWIDKNSYTSIWMQRSDRTFTYWNINNIHKFYNDFDQPLGSLGAYISVFISYIFINLISNFKMFIILKMFYQTY